MHSCHYKCWLFSVSVVELTDWQEWRCFRFYGLLIPNFTLDMVTMDYWSVLAGGDPLGILWCFCSTLIMTGETCWDHHWLALCVINLLMAFTLFVVLAIPRYNIRKGKTARGYLHCWCVSCPYFRELSFICHLAKCYLSAWNVTLGVEGVLLVSAATGYRIQLYWKSIYRGMAAMLTGGLVIWFLAFLVLAVVPINSPPDWRWLFFEYGLCSLIGKPFIGRWSQPPSIFDPGLEDLPLRFTSHFKFDLLIYLVIRDVLIGGCFTVTMGFRIEGCSDT